MEQPVVKHNIHLKCFSNNNVLFSVRVFVFAKIHFRTSPFFIRSPNYCLVSRTKHLLVSRRKSVLL